MKRDTLRKGNSRWEAILVSFHGGSLPLSSNRCGNANCFRIEAQVRALDRGAPSTLPPSLLSPWLSMESRVKCIFHSPRPPESTPRANWWLGGFHALLHMRPRLGAAVLLLRTNKFLTQLSRGGVLDGPAPLGYRRELPQLMARNITSMQAWHFSKILQQRNQQLRLHHITYCLEKETNIPLHLINF